MYPSAQDRFGIADLFGWQDIVAARGGLTLEPLRRWTISGQYFDLRLSSAADALYNTSGGAIVRDVSAKSGTHIVQEIDAFTWFELDRNVNIGFGIGHLLPGRFLVSPTKGPDYNRPYSAINFKDSGKGER